MPISVPNHRAVPRLAFDLDVRPSADRQLQRAGRQPRRGYFLQPASPFVIHNFVLDPNDPSRRPRPRSRPASTRSPATSPGSSTGAAETWSSSRPRRRRSPLRGCCGRELGVGRGRPPAAARRGGRRRGRAGAATRRPRESRTWPPRRRSLVDEVEVVAGDLDPLDVGGEAEAEHRARRPRRARRRAGRRRPRSAAGRAASGAGPSGPGPARSAPSSADRAGGGAGRDQLVESRQQLLVGERPVDLRLDARLEPGDDRERRPLLGRDLVGRRRRRRPGRSSPSSAIISPSRPFSVPSPRSPCSASSAKLRSPS